MVLDGSVLDSRENPFKMEVGPNFFVLVNMLFSSLSLLRSCRELSVKSQVEFLFY